MLNYILFLLVLYFSHAPKRKIFELISVLLSMKFHTMAVYSNGHHTMIIQNRVR